MDYSPYKQLEFRRKFWVPVGAKINVHHMPGDTPVGFIHMKAWKLKEDIRLYSDESMQQELLRIAARKVVDFSGTYDIIDSQSNQHIASLKRKGMKSTFVRDHWLVLDPQGNEIGETVETSGKLALIRRWIGIIPYAGPLAELGLAFVPQTYEMTHKQPAGSSHAAHITHRKNPFVVKINLDTTGAATPIDPRISTAMVALLSTIDAAK
ncbi:MAG TPA: hypothetical protein VGO07_03290 [Candidatus Saccharimonadales bacterium]|jgi:hypothetical protein|nr:hypothetical protein [Candidatus Saccharimonadales bacterium]